MKFLIVTAAALFFTSLSLEAEAARRDNRQHRQHHRIQEGVKSGELTRKEAAGLRAQQRKIRRMEHKAEADGTVTGGEKRRIERAQDRASKSIYKQKHDDQQRGDNAPQAPAHE